MVGGLTCGFWAVFEGGGGDLFVPGPARTAGGFAWRGWRCGGVEEGRSVVAPFGLHSGLRRQGAHPSRKKPRDEWGTRRAEGVRSHSCVKCERWMGHPATHISKPTYGAPGRSTLLVSKSMINSTKPFTRVDYLGIATREFFTKLRLADANHLCPIAGDNISGVVTNETLK